MTTLPTVLIFTYSEYGQANVNLATAYELALSGTNVYIASFSSLKSRVLSLQELVARHASRTGGKPAGSIRFHECRGFLSWQEAVMKYGVEGAIFSHSHGVSGALESYTKLEIMMFPWSREEYTVGIESCKEIIATVKPNAVAVDVLFTIAQDACKLVDQKFVIMSPVSVKALAVGLQPYLAAFWKYPAISSGFSFPLKWWQIPLNIYLNTRLVIETKTSVRINDIETLRRSFGFKPVFCGQLDHLDYGITHIIPALPEIDFPLAVIPSQILLCGPIVMPFDPVEVSDPALAKWLDNGPTVMVNLGSHVISDSRAAKQMASAFRILLDYHGRQGASKIQVLWKAMASGDIQIAIDSIIGNEIKEGRVKVVPWLEAEPASILLHPNLICTVHHGGANSFYEGVWSGVPHIVLPVWYDTYDHATCVEYLNIGIFGNKTCAPSVGAEEFGGALVRVTGNAEEATEFRRTAKYLKEVCRKKGNGRELASMAILRATGIKYGC